MARTKKQTENTLKKHSAAIQIHGNITLLQRKAWNILLWNAYDELLSKDRHSIRVPYLIQKLGFNSDNDDYLREALKALVHCGVEWNILDKEGNEKWGVAALLASAEITQGICVYEYASVLREKLYNPSMYARLDLDLQKRFDSKHALALWELCTDYLGAKRDYGETPWIAVEDFRKLFSIGKNTYPEFWRIIQKVITPAKDEVSRVSDFNVAVEYQHQGRKTTALKFKMRRVALLPEPAPTQPSLFPEHDDMPPLVKELKDAGLAIQDALQIWQQGFDFVEERERPTEARQSTEEAFTAYVQEKIHLLKRRQSSGKVENVTGFLREAIRRNYANPEYLDERRKEYASMQRKAADAAQRQATARQERQAALERQRDDAIQARVAESPVLLDQAVAWAREHAEGFSFVYKLSKSAADNYQDSIGVRAILNSYLTRQHPAAFEDIYARYEEAIQTLHTA